MQLHPFWAVAFSANRVTAMPGCHTADSGSAAGRRYGTRLSIVTATLASFPTLTGD